MAYWCGVMKDDVCGDRSTIAVRLRVAVASEELALEVLVWLFGVGGGGMCATVGCRGVCPLCCASEWVPNPTERAEWVANPTKDSQKMAVQVVSKLVFAEAQDE